MLIVDDDNLVFPILMELSFFLRLGLIEKFSSHSVLVSILRDTFCFEWYLYWFFIGSMYCVLALIQ